MQKARWAGILAGLWVIACCAAQAVDFVTSQAGGPDHYVPLLNSPAQGAVDVSAVSGNPVQAQAAIISQGALVHNAVASFSYGTLPAAIEPLPPSTLPTSAGVTVSPSAAAGDYTPPPFNSLANAVSYIQHQTADSSNGLPQTYYEPSGVTTGEQVIDEGVGLYDTSLALMALIQNGNLSQAKQILDIYNSGQYGNTDLEANPNQYNGGAFAPFDNNTYYYFDDADATGKYDPNWNQYGSHTGPNAWLALAACQYIQAERKAGVSDTVLAPYLTMVARIGNAMIALQNAQTLGLNDQTQGAVRYGPHQTYEDPFETVNTENNVSAYSAFNSIAQVMQKSTLSSFSSTASMYSNASGKIVNWLQNATVYTASGQRLKGMRDPATGLFYKGADYENGKWVIEPQLAEDSGGSWAISALGPKLIDSIWGKGTAYSMWEAIRTNFGRTEGTPGDPSTIRPAGPNDPLVGMDYSNLYPSNEALISPEWTGGAVNALKQIISYYQPSKELNSSQLRGLYSDYQGMTSFLASGQDSYAVGPGLTDARQGNTGFGWESAPASVTAMASIYGTLKVDPLNGSQINIIVPIVHPPTHH